MEYTTLITTALILAISIGLFVYWFRYTCLLILSARTTRDYASEIAMAKGLGFIGLQQQLLTSTLRSDLDQINASLQRDYGMISSLLRTGGDTNPAIAPEDAILRVDYTMMKAWYVVARTFSSRQAAVALDEMCQIVNYFANAMGERAASAATL
jgi:hypothetical protein